MPLPVAHTLLGASVVAALEPGPLLRSNYHALLVGAVMANVADLDFLLVYALHSKTWHRGFSHSLVFAALVCVFCLLWGGRQRLRTAAAYGIAFASHSVLDFATTKKGTGVELLWPFYRQKLVLGWCGLSETPSKMPPFEIVKSLLLEFALFAPLLLAISFLRSRSRMNSINEIVER